MEWPVEVVDNDGVPSILGVDLLKHLGATLQYSGAGDAGSWINDLWVPGHRQKPVPSGTSASASQVDTWLQ